MASLKRDNYDPGFRINLTLPAEPLPDLQALAGRCEKSDVHGDSVVLHRKSLDGLPGWVVSLDATFDDGDDAEPGLFVVGNYRGLVVFLQAARRSTGLTDADLAACVKVFNDQVAKLEAAPA